MNKLEKLHKERKSIENQLLSKDELMKRLSYQLNSQTVDIEGVTSERFNITSLKHDRDLFGLIITLFKDQVLDAFSKEFDNQEYQGSVTQEEKQGQLNAVDAEIEIEERKLAKLNKDKPLEQINSNNVVSWIQF